MQNYRELRSIVNNKEYFFHLIDKATNLPCLIYPIAKDKGFGCVAVYLTNDLDKIHETRFFDNVEHFESTVVEFDTSEFDYELNGIGYSSDIELPSYFFDKIYKFRDDFENRLYPICELNNYYLVYNQSLQGGFIRACNKGISTNLDLIDFKNLNQVDKVEKLIFEELSNLKKNLIGITLVINQYLYVKNEL
jgi:hypothetical protein